MQMQDGIVCASEKSANGPAWQVTRQTLRGGMQEGVELLNVDNGKLNFTVIPTRGMSLYRVDCGDIRLGWDSPVRQIVHPRHVNLNDFGGLGWLSAFNEMLVRCGVAFAGHPGEDGGRLLTLHGRIGNIPASDVRVSVDDEPPHQHLKRHAAGTLFRLAARQTPSITGVSRGTMACRDAGYSFGRDHAAHC